MKRIALSPVLIFFLSALLPLTAQDVSVSAVKHINWEEGLVTIDITASTGTAWTALSSRYDMDKLISKRAPVLTAEMIADIPVSSLDTIGSAILRNTSLYGDLLKLTDTVGKTFSTAAEDRKSLTVRYDIPVFPHIASLFIERSEADPVSKDLRYYPTEDFTGILIYAAEEMPLSGTNRKSALNPSIFPRLFDEDLNLILDMSKMDPEYLRRWGTAGFSYDRDRTFYGDRVGAFPLRTMAEGYFGMNSTDIILPERAVRRILSSDNNRELLTEGRVLIICSRPES
ncbi:MAG: hypothetical protein JXR86_18585 [Spirochaetales bacterium]|nr:hypothetical protein [Spirochaetales bacterium]